MKKKLIGAALLAFIGIAVVVAVMVLAPMFKDRQQVSTSDAKKTKGVIRIALDNWIGYFPLRSPEMKRAMRIRGWRIAVVDDKADYPKRMQQLEEGKFEFAVVTVDSFLLNAAKFNFPGVVIMVIDESKGGDAILARADKVNNLSDIKGKMDIRVAFTPNSPSHHLLKAVAAHFNVPELLPSGHLRIETNGSEEALKKLLSGKTDVAVLWEPDVSRALANPRIKKLIGTDDTKRLIVDILVVNRSWARNNPNLVKLFLSTYFTVLKKYRENPDLLKKHVKADTGMGDAQVDSMLKGVRWVNLTENCLSWFGISAPGENSDEGLVNTVTSTVDILVSAGDFSKSPLPDNDPYRIINSSYLEQLFRQGLMGFGQKTSGGFKSADSLAAKFPRLSASQWKKLQVVGSLKVDPVIFQSGSAILDILAKEIIDKAVEALKHYPHFRLVIKGHTSTEGDRRANVKLSQERSDAVARYLNITYGIDPNRLRSTGLGGRKPLKQLPGETYRSWLYRLPRVELVLVRENY
ncbi:MAG: OmpA family protein [Planctomycetes bacterium]|nr:OmpA family protein [Planctomycetota bacterium]